MATQAHILLVDDEPEFADFVQRGLTYEGYVVQVAHSAGEGWDAVMALVASLGLAMGMPFPAGLRWLRATSGRRFVAWMWGVNGLASVVGSTVAVAVAMWGGFSWSLLLGSLIYLGLFAGSSLYARPVIAEACHSTLESLPTSVQQSV